MKKLVSLIIVLFCLAGIFAGCAETEKTVPADGEPDTLNPVDAITYDFRNFDAEMLEYVEETQQGSYVISPISLKLVLGMLVPGANGETLEQILRAIGTDGKTFDEYLKNFSRFAESFNHFHADDPFSLESANSVWKNKAAQDLKSDYKMHLEAFDAQVREFEPDTVIGEVNGWADEKTHGLIKKILADDYDADSIVIMLLNALYYKNEWADQFVQIEQPIDFTALDGTVSQKTYFSATERFKYFSDGDTTLAVIPMRGNVDMVLVKGSTDRLEEKLAMAEEKYLHLTVPEFKIETALDKKELVSFMADRGMTDAFCSAADFSKMTGEGIFVSDIIQKAVIEANNGGVEAAAVTAIIAPGSSMVTEEPLSVRFDSTFRFYITANSSEWSSDSFVLFEGRVAE